MRSKTHNLALFIFCLGFTVNAANAFAQFQTKDFGWSLKRFQNNPKEEKKDKKQKKEKDSVRISQPNSPTGTPAKSQNSNVGKVEAASGDEIIRVETNLLINDILVVDEKGAAVPNLKAEDFIVSEDGAEQKIELFAYGENAKLPRSIVLIMSGHFLSYQSTKNGVSGAELLINKLAPQDKMAIVTPDLKLILPFTKDKELLKKTVTDIPAKLNGLTPVKDYGTLMAVLNEMFDEKDVRPIIIFQSCGGELFGLKPDGDTQLTSEFNRKTFLKFQGERGYGFSDVKESIIKSRATIYSIVPTMRFVGVPNSRERKDGSQHGRRARQSDERKNQAG